MNPGAAADAPDSQEKSMSPQFATPRAAQAAPVARPSSIATAAGQLLRSAISRMARRLRGRQATLSLHELDEATLRDLGISRSELDSIELEASGRIEITRRRLLCAPVSWVEQGPRR